MAEFEGHESDVNEVQFLPDGLSFVTGSDDSTCHMYDVRSTRLLNSFERTYCGVTSVTVSESGRLVFAAYDDEEIHVYDSLKGGGERDRERKEGSRDRDSRSISSGLQQGGGGGGPMGGGGAAMMSGGMNKGRTREFSVSSADSPFNLVQVLSQNAPCRCGHYGVREKMDL